MQSCKKPDRVYLYYRGCYAHRRGVGALVQPEHSETWEWDGDGGGGWVFVAVY